jgi:hypothetical protein
MLIVTEAERGARKSSRWLVGLLWAVSTLLAGALLAPCFRPVEFRDPVGGVWKLEAKQEPPAVSVFPPGFSSFRWQNPHSQPLRSGTVRTLRVWDWHYYIVYHKL